jgi:ATP-dependent Lhr-like helicase
VSFTASETWEIAYHNWFKQRNWKIFPFQQECAIWYFQGYDGLLNAPTGSGKTFALAIPAIVESCLLKPVKGPVLLWVTPLKALSKDIHAAIQEAADELKSGWSVALRNGDTTTAERARQKKSQPQCIITTPESLHLMLATKGYADFFGNLKTVVVDEWHELLGSKRGVQVELALSRLRAVCPKLRTWGISATIGNLEEAREVLIPFSEKVCTVKSETEKKPVVTTLLPDTPETLPWAGHLGIKMLEKTLPVIEQSKTALIFTNTRSQSEIWYQRLLDAKPDLAGRLAIHHGSLNREVREWVEENLHSGLLKAVVCTSSLDLGVDFRPVDSVIQIGSPKGVARFVQRAGRSGHSPEETSKIWFVPTHSLELLEAAALKTAIEQNTIESRIPVVRAFDVLIQYLMTLAVSDGFCPRKTLLEVRETYSFSSIGNEEWNWLIGFLSHGGDSLQQYGDFHKIVFENERYVVKSRRLALQHRLSIGTIAGDTNIRIKMVGGPELGTIEEYFVSRLNLGDAFVFAGRVLELVSLQGNRALVKKATKKTGAVPSWQGGRMSLSSELSEGLRMKIAEQSNAQTEELKALDELFALQKERSAVPNPDELLIEYHVTDEGHHLFVFPFEGRMVNEGMAMLIAYRMGKIKPGTYSIAMNDYGFELLSPEPIPLEEALEEDLFSTQNLIADLFSCTNYTEMTGRRFSEIARISGLVFKGTVEKPVKTKHLQANARLFYQVFSEYEPENLLLRQAQEETLYYQLEEHRLRAALQRASALRLIIQRPGRYTPFSFPIMVDRLRGELSTESVEKRIERMILAEQEK